MALSLDSLDLLPPTGGEGGTPLRIPLDAIDEDPDQPRQEFDDQSLDELAEVAWAAEVWDNQIVEIVKAVMSVMAKRTL